MGKPERLALFIIILLAFALRVYRLDQQDLWGDEGTSYKITKVALPELVLSDLSVLPPFYYLLLNLWTRLAGQSLFVLRFPSLLMGLFTVALIYRLARSLLGEGAGPIAAFVCAISPVQVYYSQETRMYTLVTIEAALLTWFLIRLWEKRTAPCSIPLWSGYFLTALAAIYTHYSTVFIIAAQALWVLFKWRRRLRRFMIGNGILILCYTPWILLRMATFQRQVHTRFHEWNVRSLFSILRSGFTAFSVGLTVEEPLASWLATAFFLVMAAGLGSSLLKGRIKGWLLCLCLFIPLALAWVVNPLWAFFHPRYLLVSFPAFCVLFSHGLQTVAGRRWALMAVLACLMAASAYSLRNYFFDDSYVKGKYGTMMRYVQAHAQPGDFILLENREQWPLFDYYRPTDIPHAYFPHEKAASDDDVHQEMMALTERCKRVWLVMFGNPLVHDAHHRVKRWLAQHGYIAFREGFLDSELSLFVIAREGQKIRHPLAANLGDQIVLMGYGLSTTEARGDDTLLLSLYWKAKAKVEKPYTVFSHLLDKENHIWAQMDSQPVGGTYPTSAWEVGEVVQDNYGLEIPPNIPTGEFILEVGMYFLPTLERLPVKDASGRSIEGDRMVLTLIRIKN